MAAKNGELGFEVGFAKEFSATRSRDRELEVQHMFYCTIQYCGSQLELKMKIKCKGWRNSRVD